MAALPRLRPNVQGRGEGSVRLEASNGLVVEGPEDDDNLCSHEVLLTWQDRPVAMAWIRWNTVERLRRIAQVSLHGRRVLVTSVEPVLGDRIGDLWEAQLILTALKEYSEKVWPER